MPQVKIVDLVRNQAQVRIGTSRRYAALRAAGRVTLSEHEHEWTRDEQRSMAEFCLWAAQRLAAIHQCVGGDLEHSK